MASPMLKNAGGVSIIENDNGLTLIWPEGFSRFFHYIWLRNCCCCKHCGSTYLGTSTLQPSDVPLDIRPSHVTDCNDGHLEITWSEDGHRSRYLFSWLRDNAYHDEDRLCRKHRPVLWNGAISSEPPAVDFEQAGNSVESRLDFLRKLRDYGFVIVRNGPQRTGSVEVVSGLVGNLADAAYGKIFDLNPDKNKVTFGNTMNFVPPHTDEAYLASPPGINVLHCVRPADHGGESILVDGFYLAGQLRKHSPAHFETLATVSQPFHRIVPDDGVYQYVCAKVFTLDDEDEVVGFRYHTRALAPLNVSPERVVRLHAANSALSRLMLDPANQACFKLAAGEAVFFDNHRVMHARKAFDDPRRHMQICNVSRENFHLKLRMTAHRAGHATEADQVLGAGVAG